MGMWEMQCQSCEAFDSCGGGITAPCGCMWTGAKRYQCSECIYACKERSINRNGSTTDTFSEYFQAGLDIEQIEIYQNKDVLDRLPLLIPSQTRQLPQNSRVSCAAILAYDFLCSDRRLFVKPSKHLRSDIDLRKYFRIAKSGNAIGVFNSKDDLLEKLWRTDRKKIYSALKKSNFLAVVGPTYSINKFDSKVSIPESHSVVMLRRHGRILQELSDNGIFPIPNIYWRGYYDLNKWLKMMDNNESISVISRDFSCTKRDNLEYHIMVNQFIEFLSMVDRKIHVIVNGVGHAKAQKLLTRISEVGCTCSFVTSDPVLKGRNGKIITDNFSVEKSDLGFGDLAIQNVLNFESHLQKVASSFSTYSYSS